MNQGESWADLRFYLSIKLARYYARDNQPKEAIHFFNQALSIKPTSVIANFRIATLYESIGSGQDAIAHYRPAEKDRTVSEDLREFLEHQAQRVET
ncbi:MAG: Tetratricopeptide repeat protein [Syntrophorhabdus sp. PtaU1.Bin050]|nr:MAG: Tetratricopeptide repeat protein [Syntrophorhabdus sp. PtaU1.Bin050]